MSDGFAALDEMIRRIRSLRRFAADAAPDVAQMLKGHFEQQIAAGRDAEGAAWKLTKDGRKPLAGAAKALAVRPVGTMVLATLSGHEVFHHYGTKRVPKREILPAGSLPAALADAIKAGLVRRFRKHVGGN